MFLGGSTADFFVWKMKLEIVAAFFLVFWWVFLGDFCMGKPGNHDLRQIYISNHPR